jgi:hypothetical protein
LSHLSSVYPTFPQLPRLSSVTHLPSIVTPLFYLFYISYISYNFSVKPPPPPFHTVPLLSSVYPTIPSFPALFCDSGPCMYRVRKTKKGHDIFSPLFCVFVLCQRLS